MIGIAKIELMEQLIQSFPALLIELVQVSMLLKPVGHVCDHDMNVVCDALPLQESHPPANTRSKVSHSSVSATHRARERHSIPVHKSISLDVVLINGSCGLVLM